MSSVTTHPVRLGSRVQAFASRRLAHVLLLGAIAALPVVLNAPYLSEPFEVDEGVYATVAQGILDGQVPYRDLFDHKPPLVYAWYALGFLGFGEQAESPRIVAALLLGLTALTTYGVASALWCRRVGYLAGLLLGLMTGLQLLQANANTEVFMLLPMTASLLAAALWLDRGGHRWLLASGCLSGIAVMTKPVAVFGLVAVLAVVWGRSAGSTRERAMGAVPVALGAGIAGGLVVLPFVLLGAFDEMFAAIVEYNLRYSADVSSAEKAQRLWTVGLRYFPIVAGPFLIIAAAGTWRLVRRRAGARTLLVLGWSASSVLGVLLSGRFYPHYFVQLLPALALLSGVAAGDAVPRVRSVGRPSRAAVGLLTAVIATTFITLALHLPAYTAATPEARHHAKFPGEQGLDESRSAALGGYLSDRTMPGDRIYDLGIHSEIYFYADRLPAAPVMYRRPFLLQPGALEETVRHLQAAPPPYIVDTDRVMGPLPAAGFTAQVGDYYYPPEFAELLKARYEFVEVVEYAAVYRLREEFR